MQSLYTDTVYVQYILQVYCGNTAPILHSCRRFYICTTFGTVYRSLAEPSGRVDFFARVKLLITGYQFSTKLSNRCNDCDDQCF